MKIITSLFFIFILFGYKADGQHSSKQNNLEKFTPSKFEAKQFLFTDWNTNDGLPYKQVPGVNLGVTSFLILDQTTVCFLSDASNELIIFNKETRKVSSKFPVVFSPKDVLYENAHFYVLSERQVIVYNIYGLEINRFALPEEYFGRASRLVRFNDATYLLLGSGNSLKIEYKGHKTEVLNEINGWMTSSGIVIGTRVNGDNSYMLEAILQNGEILNKKYTTEYKAAGIFVVGVSADKIILDVQEFTSERPIAIKRSLVSIDFSNEKLGSLISSIKIPDCYFVLSNKDFDLNADGNIFNMVTAPDGVYVFSLSESTFNNSNGYPENLIKMNYHFNNHLIKIKE